MPLLMSALIFFGWVFLCLVAAVLLSGFISWLASKWPGAPKDPDERP